jgi:hypothetical protein
MPAGVVPTGIVATTALTRRSTTDSVPLAAVADVQLAALQIPGEKAR